MKFTKKIVLALVVLALVCTVAFGMIACDKATTNTPATTTTQDAEPKTIDSVKTFEDGTLVFTQDNAILADVTGKHVVDYMSALKAQGYIEYEMTGSMVTTVGGKGVDSSNHEFWAFYTTDTENSSDMYGDPIVIDGVTYHSANFGIVDMPLKAGAGYAFKVATW